MNVDSEKYGKVPLDQQDIYELHAIRLKWFEDKGCTPAEMMSYLMSEFVGSLALCGYSDEFVRKTFDMMYEKYKNHSMKSRFKLDQEE